MAESANRQCQCGITTITIEVTDDGNAILVPECRHGERRPMNLRSGETFRATKQTAYGPVHFEIKMESTEPWATKPLIAQESTEKADSLQPTSATSSTL